MPSGAIDSTGAVAAPTGTGSAASGARPAARPATLARRELARALGGALAAPFRLLAWLPRRGRDRALVRLDLGADAPACAAPEASFARLALPGNRPLRVFLSAAEASGEIHATSLVHELRARAAAEGAPPPEFTAFGGERLRALGVTTLGDPVARARTNFDGVVAALPYYVGLLEDAARHAQQAAPDVFVPVDSPALHVPMARCVRAAGVPVVHLVAPQYWGWAPWRVGAYRRTIDRALTLLPHEPSWYRRHGVATAHIGHPLLDALAGVPVTHPDPASRTLAVLPGSRAGVIRRNLPWMLASLRLLRAAWPDVDVAILQATDEHVPLVAELAREHDARIVVGDLHGELARARLAFAVSGTVLTDVLHHRLPAVVVYRVARRFEAALQRALLTVPYFASTNLLAGRAVVPEYGFAGAGPRADVERDLVALFGDGLRRSACTAGLELAAARLGPPGAIQRAAAHVLEVAAARPRG